jgi:hypothetical protein
MGSMSEDEISEKELETIDRVIQDFDFDRAQTTMRALNWTWAGSKDVPTIRVMEREARRLLRAAALDAHHQFNNDPRGGNGYRGTGGFRATCTIRPTGEVDFELLFYVDKCSGSTGD